MRSVPVEDRLWMQEAGKFCLARHRLPGNRRVRNSKSRSLLDFLPWHGACLQIDVKA
jgi:hypothetical protein